MPNEIELKLRIAAEDTPLLRRHTAIKRHLVTLATTRRLVSIYYDTPDLQLLDAGISLRVRRMSGKWFQAVKGAGHSLAGLHRRMEWEDVIAKGEPDFTKITDPGLARQFKDEALRNALKPIFITDVKRTEWQLAYEDGSTLEFALDSGELQVGSHHEPISEVEIELKQGHAIHLYELALALQANIPLHIENISKAQRGYALLRPQLPGISRAQAIPLHGKTPRHEAFQIIARECLRHLQGNQDVALVSHDPEGVHQMHVALRRMNMAFKLFRQKNSALKSELRWISRLLGNARDRDIFLHETLPAMAKEFSGQLVFSTLQKFGKMEQDRSYTSLRQGLNSQRYQRLLLAVGAWLESGGTKITAKHKLRKLAENQLQRNYEKLKKHGESLPELSPENLHKARIEIKHLRYASEFFAQVFDAKGSSNSSAAFIEKLVQLQELLGTLNDITVTEKLVHQLVREPAGKNISKAVDLVTRWNASRAAQANRGVDKTWQSFLRAKPYWH